MGCEFQFNAQLLSNFNSYPTRRDGNAHWSGDRSNRFARWVVGISRRLRLRLTGELVAKLTDAESTGVKPPKRGNPGTRLRFVPATRAPPNRTRAESDCPM